MQLDLPRDVLDFVGFGILTNSNLSAFLHSSRRDVSKDNKYPVLNIKNRDMNWQKLKLSGYILRFVLNIYYLLFKYLIREKPVLS